MASFSAAQKEHMLSALPHSLCCRRNLLLGALALRGHAEGREVCLHIESFLIPAFTELIEKIYSAKVTVRKKQKGGRGTALCFESPSAARAVTDFAQGTFRFLPKCEDCIGAVFLGFFLCAGRLSDIEKSVRLELCAPGREEAVQEYIGGFDIEFKIAKQKNQSVLYIKTIDKVVDFLLRAGMQSTAFLYTDLQFTKQVRENINRENNCMTHNIDKAATASAEQLTAIHALTEWGILFSLPDELVATARLRLAHPDMSLSQLCHAVTPAISKSGLSHRLSKIVSIYKQKLSEKNNAEHPS